MTHPLKSVFIYAAKDISQNRRIPLLATYFADKGLEVTVMSYSMPHPTFDDERITYLALIRPTLIERILRWYETSEQMRQPHSLTEKRMGSHLLGFITTGVEKLRHIFRKPLTTIALGLFSKGLPDSVIKSAKERSTHAFLLRERLGPSLSRKRRQRFTQDLSRFLDGKINLGSVLICHDRFQAKLTDKYQNQAGMVFFDMVELIDKRTFLSLEENNPLNAEEIRSAKKIIKTATNLTVSEAISTFVKEEYGLQALTIFNGRPLNHWYGQNKHDGHQEVTLAFSGGFIPGCGLVDILKCLSYLPPSYKLLLAGYYSSKQYEILIHDVIKKCNLESRIIFSQSPSVDEMPKILSQADVYLIPFTPKNANLYVSMPNRLFDAIAAGLPIISQKGLHLSEFVKDNNIGYELDFTDAESASEFLGTIISDGEALDNCRNSVYECFQQTAWDNQIKKLDGYF